MLQNHQTGPSADAVAVVLQCFAAAGACTNTAVDTQAIVETKKQSIITLKKLDDLPAAATGCHILVLLPSRPHDLARVRTWHNTQ